MDVLDRITTLSHDSAEELYQQWRRLSALRRTVGQNSDAIGKHWQTVTDPVERAKVWQNYEQACREYDVVSAWTELVHSFYVFATQGGNTSLTTLSDSTAREPALAG